MSGAGALAPGSADVFQTGIRPRCHNGPVSGPTILELELDLDAYAGPFDLLLALVLREEIDLVEVPVAEIVIEYIERLAEVEELDLEAVSEFLLLVAALCEVKARRLLGEGDSDIEEQGPEEAAAELAARLAEYQRFRAAAGWLGARREELGRRFFRTRSRAARAATAPRRPAGGAARRRSSRRSSACSSRRCTSTSRPCAGAACPSARSFAASASCFASAGTFLFDEQVDGLVREEQAAAFLALLELYKRGELRAGQAEAFGPIRVARTRRAAAPRRPAARGRAEPEQAVA